MHIKDAPEHPPHAHRHDRADRGMGRVLRRKTPAERWSVPPGLGVVETVWCVGRGIYRSPGAVSPATTAEPEPLAVGVYLSLAPAMMYPPSLAEES